MVDITAVSSLFTGLKAAVDLATGLKDAVAEQEIRLKMSDLLNSLLSAQASAAEARLAQHELLNKIKTLEEIIAAHDAWNAEAAKYELSDAGQGVMAYRIKAAADTGEPQYWLCPTCFSEKKKSVLQPETRLLRHTKWLVCRRCNTELIIKGMKPTPIEEFGPAAPRSRY